MAEKELAGFKLIGWCFFLENLEEIEFVLKIPSHWPVVLNRNLNPRLPVIVF